jgi:hypothetical protein
MARRGSVSFERDTDTYKLPDKRAQRIDLTAIPETLLCVSVTVP